MSMREKLELLQRKRAESEQGGGAERIQAQHDKHKMTARERLDALVDPGSFVELDRFVTHRSSDFGLADEKYLGDGVVTGHARIDGRPVCVFAQSGAGFGTISGVVNDASGAPVPGSKVEVINEVKGIHRSLETNADGVFNAPSLAPDANYSVTATKDGFCGLKCN